MVRLKVVQSPGISKIKVCGDGLPLSMACEVQPLPFHQDLASLRHPPTLDQCPLAGIHPTAAESLLQVVLKQKNI